MQIHSNKSQLAFTCVILLTAMIIWFAVKKNSPEPIAENSGSSRSHSHSDTCGLACSHPHASREHDKQSQLSPEQMNTLVRKARDFSDWSAQVRYKGEPLSDEALAQGIELASKRRDAMVTLILEDPDEALRQAMGYAEYAALPVEIQELVEKPFSIAGDLKVQIACGENYSQYSHELVSPEGEILELSMPERHRTGLTKNNLPVQGISLDGHGVVRSQAFQLINSEDAGFVRNEWPTGQSDPSIDFISGTPIEGEGITAVAGGMVFHFQDLASLIYINQVMAEADARPGMDTGSNQLMLAANGAELAQFPEEQFIAETTEASISSTSGVRTALFIVVNFPDDLTDPDPQNQLDSIVNGEVNDALQRYSHGQASLSATISETITLPNNKSYYTYSYSTIHYGAIDAYIAAGNPDPRYNYGTIAVVFEDLGFPFAGLAAVSGQEMWLQDTISARTILHEFGHNYGLKHGQYWIPSNSDPVDPGGSTQAYGNYFDNMGTGTVAQGHFTPGPKAFLGWIPAHDWEDLSGSGDNGTYRVHRFDHKDSTGTRGLRIAKSATSDHYWIGYRRDYESNRYFANGAVLHWERGAGVPNRNMCWLIDTTPGSADERKDSAISVGRTYSDTASDVHITTLGTGGSAPNEYIDVAVNFGPFPGNSAPTGTILGYTTVSARQSFTFTADAVDTDGDALAFDWDMGDGLDKPNSATITHSWALGGTYDVTVIVSDMKGGTATLQKTVTVTDDLQNWTTKTSGTTNTLHSIASNGVSAVAVGNGVILRSTDGDTWNDVSPDGFSLFELHDVCWTGIDYVAVGEDHGGSSYGWVKRVIFSSPDGTSWHLVHAYIFVDTGALNGVTSDGSGVAVAVGDKGNVMRRSDTGTWSAVSGIPSNVYLQDVAYGEGTYVCAGNPGYNGSSSVFTSPDGLTWSDHSGGTTFAYGYSNFSTLDHTGEHFVGSGFYTRECHSLDQGQTWSTNHVDANYEIEAYAMGGGIVYGVGFYRSGNRVDYDMVSTDGLNWVFIDASEVPDRNGLAYFADHFISVGENGSIRQSGFVGGSHNYASFASDHFPGGGPDAMPGANPDGDWADNLMEYALGTDPTSTASKPARPAISFDESGYPVLEVSRIARRADINYTVWWSSDLAGWTQDGLTVEIDHDFMLKVVADGQGSADMGFLRLEVQQ